MRARKARATSARDSRSVSGAGNAAPSVGHRTPAAGPAAPSGGRRWKVWVLTVAGIYPAITVLALTTAPLLAGVSLPVRLALLVPTATAAMVWLIMPCLQRYFGAWLMR